MSTSVDAIYFNVIDGEFSLLRPTGDIYYEGETAKLIYCLFENDLKSNAFTKLDRKKALDAMIQYYQIHIPQFGNLTSLPIIYDILYA
jgi:DNA repair protein RecO (recombination protein O)